MVMAIAYDVPIPGYDTYNTINLRLWSSKPHNVLISTSINISFDLIDSRLDGELYFNCFL
jgi:glucan phosphorylase